MSVCLQFFVRQFLYLHFAPNRRLCLDMEAHIILEHTDGASQQNTPQWCPSATQTTFASMILSHFGQDSQPAAKKGLNKQSHSSFPSSFSYLLQGAAPSLNKDRISYIEITATFGKKPQCTQVINYFPSGLLALQEKSPHLPCCSSTGRQKYADSGDGATFALPVRRNRFPCIAQHDFERTG